MMGTITVQSSVDEIEFVLMIAAQMMGMVLAATIVLFASAQI